MSPPRRRPLSLRQRIAEMDSARIALAKMHSRDLHGIRKELKGIRAELARIHSANPSPFGSLADFLPAIVAPAAAMMALRACGGKSKGKKKSKPAPTG